MKTFADRFRRWYEYERDCNAKTLAMLASVPAERRGTPEFQKAVDRMAHLVAARQRWLHRLGHWPEAPAAFPQGTPLDELPGRVAGFCGSWGKLFAPTTVKFQSETFAVPAREIIEFAEKFDPQKFHLNAKSAERSIFCRRLGCDMGLTCQMSLRISRASPTRRAESSR